MAHGSTALNYLNNIIKKRSGTRLVYFAITPSQGLYVYVTHPNMQYAHPPPVISMTDSYIIDMSFNKPMSVIQDVCITCITYYTTCNVYLLFLCEQSLTLRPKKSNTYYICK